MDNGNEPATKQDLADVRIELKQDFADVRSELKADMRAMEDRLIAAFRDSRTDLLNAFYRFTESNSLRVSQLEGNQRALISRIGTLEDRMTDIERRVKFPDRPTQ